MFIFLAVIVTIISGLAFFFVWIVDYTTNVPREKWQKKDAIVPIIGIVFALIFVVFLLVNPIIGIICLIVGIILRIILNFIWIIFK